MSGNQGEIDHVKREKEDKIQEFIRNNTVDQSEISRYKRYKKYEEFGDKWIPRYLIPSLFLFISIALVNAQILNSDYDTIINIIGIIWALSAFVLFIILMVGIVAQWISETTREDVAYHELAAAFGQYRSDGDVTKAKERLENSYRFFKDSRFSRISSKDKEEIESYMKKVRDTQKVDYLEDEFHRTFPEFMQEISTSVTRRDETVFAKMAKDLDTAYTGEPDIKEGIKKDVKRIISAFSSGMELITLISLGAAGIAVMVFGASIGTGIGVFGGLIGVYSLYQNTR